MPCGKLENKVFRLEKSSNWRENYSNPPNKESIHFHLCRKSGDSKRNSSKKLLMQKSKSSVRTRKSDESKMNP